ncbi:MAG: CRISPR/Cas system CMR-associated protein Cmr5 small subunit [Bacteriovoracaceae bacterium]|jgi:CRISPR/Cas system CMR-associated protein Cmr5 small subunit
MRFLLLLFTIAFLSCESNAIDEAKLLGPDKDNNGVRDDIDKWINKTYKNHDQIKAAKLKAKYNRLALKFHKDKEKSNQYTHKALDLSNCLANLVKNFKLWSKRLDSYHLLTYNTRERLKVYTIVNSNFSGQVGYIETDLVKSCEFKLTQKELE